MVALLLGISTGVFMAAFINRRYNTSRWIKTKYLVWTGVVVLTTSCILGWSDIK